VETKAQARLLRGLGCDIGQGFHFGAPQPPAELDGLVRAARPRALG
jgi:EAL domain-containing protein (putative c-di-GMP-specific phosphodiesterase class I)